MRPDCPRTDTHDCDLAIDPDDGACGTRIAEDASPADWTPSTPLGGPDAD